MSKQEQKRDVVLADWDNTLRAGFTVTAWTEFLAGRGLFSALPTILQRFDRFLNDRSADYEVFCKDMEIAYAAGLAGQPGEEVAAAAASFVAADSKNIFRFVRPLCEYFADRQLSIIVISGAPEEPLKQYARTLGFELGGALRLEVRDGFYTGQVIENCGLSKIKSEAVSRVSAENDGVVALADSLSDMPLLDAARCRFVVGGAPHHAVPVGPNLLSFASDDDPDLVLQHVRRCVDGVDPSK